VYIVTLHGVYSDVTWCVYGIYWGTDVGEFVSGHRPVLV
jgi:hypothetical protein